MSWRAKGGGKIIMERLFFKLIFDEKKLRDFSSTFIGKQIMDFF